MWEGKARTVQGARDIVQLRASLVMGSGDEEGLTMQERTPAAPCACVDASDADASALLVARPCSAPCGDGAAAAAERPGPAATPT